MAAMRRMQSWPSHFLLGLGPLLSFVIGLSAGSNQRVTSRVEAVPDQGTPYELAARCTCRPKHKQPGRERCRPRRLKLHNEAR